MREINKTMNGMLSICECCNVYQLEFGNIFFCFKKEDLQAFRKYIKSIDGRKSIEANKDKPYNRKIMLRFPIRNIFFCLSLEELDELRALLFIDRTYSGSKHLISVTSLSLSAN